MISSSQQMNIPIIVLSMLTSISPVSNLEVPNTDINIPIVEKVIFTEDTSTKYKYYNDYSKDENTKVIPNKKMHKFVEEAYEMFGGMRNLTKEEYKIYRNHLKKISKPLGRNIFDLV